MPSEVIQILKFIVVGIINTTLDLVLFGIFLNRLSKSKFWKKFSIKVTTISHMLSFLITNSVSYVLNSNFTFKDSSTNRGFLPYFIVSVVSFTISSLLIQFFTQDRFFKFTHKLANEFFSNSEKRVDLSFKQYAFLVKLGTVGIIMFVNYIGYKLIVFGG